MTLEPRWQTDDGAVQLYRGDCLEVMPRLEEAVDAIICDLPYGTTACAWDTVIPFALLWEAYKRVIKPRGAVVLFGSQPFTTDLINSNRAMFRYEWIWQKERGSNWAMANRQPMKTHENVLVFYKNQPVYNPIKTDLDKVYNRKPAQRGKDVSHLSKGSSCTAYHPGGEYRGKFPVSIQSFARDKQIHNSQKPVALLEYLIRTYTNPGETVLDNTFGSGTTAVACINTGRRFIGIERDPGYFDVAVNRCKEALGTVGLFASIVSS